MMMDSRTGSIEMFLLASADSNIMAMVDPT